MLRSKPVLAEKVQLKDKILAVVLCEGERMTEQPAIKREWLQQLADIPVVGGVLDAVATYGRGTWLIVRRPLTFIDVLELTSRPDLGRASKFLVAGIVMTYLIDIPVFVSWKTDLPQAIFVVDRLANMLFGFCIIHSAMKIMGSTVRFGSTYAVFCYSGGLFTPILAIFYLPVTLMVGPALLSDDVSALGDPQFMAAMDAAMTSQLVIVSQLALSVLALGATVLELVWFRRLFGVGLARTGIGVFAGAAVAILVGGFVVAPILGYGERSLAAVVQFL